VSNKIIFNSHPKTEKLLLPTSALKPQGNSVKKKKGPFACTKSKRRWWKGKVQGNRAHIFDNY
jgi:hypothetical protein